MSYIEREAATVYAPLPKHQREYTTLNLDDAWEDGYDYALSQVKSAPAADVREVVLCRDCKYWFNAPAADGFNSCKRDALIRHENFFCAAGEKREES